MIFHRLSLGTFYGVLIGAPLLFGFRSPWPFAVIEALAAVSVTAWVLGMIADRRLEWRQSALDLPVGLLIVLVAVQILLGNRPLAEWALAPPPAGVTAPTSVPVPFLVLGSVSPALTIGSLLLFLTYAGVYVVVVNVIRRRSQVDTLMRTLLLLGAGLAVLGLTNAAGGGFRLTGWQDETLGRVVATFLNADHFGAWLNMLICLGLGYVVARQSSIPARSTAMELLRSAGGREHLIREYFPIFGLLVMLLALVFTLSRGALLSLLLALVIMLVLAGAIALARRSLVVTGCLLAVALVFSAWIGLDRVLAGIKRGPVDFHLRWMLSVSTLPMLEDFPVFGIGLGAYRAAYFRYQTPALPPADFFIDYAHNDVLQFMVEAGLLGTALGLWGVCRWGGDVGGVHFMGRGRCPVGGGEEEWARRNDPFSIGITLGALGALVSLGIHSVVDFPARVPANAILGSVCLGLATVAMHSRFRSEAPWISRVRSCALPGPAAALATGAAVAALCAVFVAQAFGPPITHARARAVEQLPDAAPAPPGLAPAAQLLAVRGRQQSNAALKLWNTGAAPDGRTVVTLESRRREALALLTGAVADLRASIALTPSSPHLHEFLGTAYSAMASVDASVSEATIAAATAHLRRAVALAPNNPLFYRSLLAALVWLDPDVALALWASREVIARDPRALPDVVYELLALPLTSAQWVAAVPDTAPDRLALAGELKRRGLGREARYLYDQAVVVARPDEVPFVRWLRAKAFLATADPAAALRELDLALKATPDNPELHLARGDALAATQDPEALDSYRMALLKAEALIERHPKNFHLFEVDTPRARAILAEHVGPLSHPIARYRRARAAYLTDRKLWEQALDEWNAVLAATPNDAGAYFGRGAVHDGLGRAAAAVADYRQAVSLDPANTVRRFRLAQRLWDTEQYFQAIAEWRIVTAAEPHNVEAHLALARAGLKVGDTNEARREYHEVMKLTPDHPEARRMLGPGGQIR